ncbi:MAG TPA: regulatory protein RecX [Mycobacteriales bacterium]|nr:regulatory protein RecX [Mycobacteriales bacterium]
MTFAWSAGRGASPAARRRRSSGRDPEPDATRDDGPDADPESVARAICLRLLTAGPRTRAQLADALAVRDVPPEVADAVLDRFTDVGLIDDATFAAMWVSSRHLGRGLARRALSQELRHRGVDDATAYDAVQAVSDADEEAAARELVRRRLPSLSRHDAATRTRRLVGMLQRKGYSGGLAFRVVRDVVGEEAAAAADPDDTVDDDSVAPADR